MVNLLDDAKDLEEVGKILKHSGVSKDFAKDALNMTQ